MLQPFTLLHAFYFIPTFITEHLGKICLCYFLGSIHWTGVGCTCSDILTITLCSNHRRRLLIWPRPSIACVFYAFPVCHEAHPSSSPQVPCWQVSRYHPPPPLWLWNFDRRRPGWLIIDQGWMGTINWWVQGKFETREIFDSRRPGTTAEDQGPG